MVRTFAWAAIVAMSICGCSSKSSAPQSSGLTTPAKAGGSTSVVDSRVTEECPELPERCAAVTRWVSRAITRAGYRVTGDTGGALIGTGQGMHSFYAWATKVRDGVPRERKRWPLVGAAGRLRLYGQADRRWWLTQGFVVWIEAGPFEHSVLPGGRGLRRLVEASQVLAAPKTKRLG
jgi:hypothetical protein